MIYVYKNSDTQGRWFVIAASVDREYHLKDFNTEVAAQAFMAKIVDFNS